MKRQCVSYVKINLTFREEEKNLNFFKGKTLILEETKIKISSDQNIRCKKLINSERDGNTIPPDLPPRNLYAGQEATVRTGHETTDWFQIGKGVPQGFVTLLI